MDFGDEFVGGAVVNRWWGRLERGDSVGFPRLGGRVLVFDVVEVSGYVVDVLGDWGTSSFDGIEEGVDVVLRVGLDVELDEEGFDGVYGGGYCTDDGPVVVAKTDR